MLWVSFSQSFSWAVQNVIIFCGDKWPRIYIGPSPKLLAHTAGSSKLFRPLSILLYFSKGSTSLLRSVPLEDHAIVSKGSNRWSWWWRPESQTLLRPIGHPSYHCSARWLPSRFSLIELRVCPIALPPRLAVAFICKASRFFSTLPPLARKALIYR